MSGGRFRFPQWNYGYTLGPPTLANGGNYTQFMQQPQFPSVPGGGRPPFKGGDSNKSTDTSTTSTTTPAPKTADGSIKKEPGKDQKVPAVPAKSEEGTKEEGEIIERPLSDILRGRNPIMFCNDQSKMRNLHMEWEQVSETGPPHDKTFTWSLKMGEMQTSGSANSKKTAKNKAAEEMVKKLDQLPKLHMKRNYNQAFPTGNWRGGRGGGRGGYHGGHNFYGGGVPPPPTYNKKPKKPAKPEKPPEDPNEPLHPAQNNPISKLYEHVKRKKMPEPVFEIIREEVLETRKTTQGFTYKKTKFTMQVEVMGKKYEGDSMNKKTAKFNAAAAAWADLGAGVGQASIDSLLQSGRQAAEAATKST